MSEQRLRERYDAVFDPDSESPDYDAAYIALSDDAIRCLPALLDVVEMARFALLVVTDDGASADDLHRLRVALRRFEMVPEGDVEGRRQVMGETDE